MRPGDLSNSDNFFVWLGGFPSLFVNFLCGRQLPSAFRAAWRPSINFSQLSVRWKTVHYLPSTFCAAGRPTVNFSQFTCSQETFVNFRQLSVQPEDLPSNFQAAKRPSVSFHKLFVSPGDFCQLPSTFRQAGRPSVNFPCSWKIFCELSSTCAAGKCSINFRQHFVQL